MHESDHSPFSLIADFDGDISSIFNIDIGDTLPILTLRNMVLFPGVVVPVAVGRKSSKRLTQAAARKDMYIGVVCQKDASVEHPKREDLYTTGTVAKVIRVLELPGREQRTNVILQGFCRFELGEIVSTRSYLTARVKRLDDILPESDDKEFEAMVETCKDTTINYLQANEPPSRLMIEGRPVINNEATMAIRNISNKIFLVNFICTNLPFPIEEKIELLRIDDLKQRTLKLISILGREYKFASMKAYFQERTRVQIDEQQKEYFLKQLIHNLQSELEEVGYSDGGDGMELRMKADNSHMPEEVLALFQKEVRKLERTSTQSADYNVQLSYLQTLISVPWGIYTTDNLNIKTAERILNRDHYGLEKVKERILEHLAVLSRRGDMKAPILCLYGPPGVGKTSLGRSVAEALGRKYTRISLGGVNDEAEIRGHRRTYIGAMPGRIVKSIIKAGSANPVIILDEIDKVSSSNYNGDPQSALLEVLDPEQNNTFHDNYLDVDFDLSKVMFIATANSLATIPEPLLDRLEVIEVSGYITEEKIEIARRHLIPKVMKKNGFSKTEGIRFTASALEMLIERYTRESGVRQLEKQIDKIFRKIAYQTAKSDDAPYLHSSIKLADLETLLGKPRFSRDKYQGNRYAGVVTGLAWTAVGGEILFIETSLSRGKGAKLTLTGNLGDVMKESAFLALEYIKAHADWLGIDYRIFEEWNVHIHVPEGAVPKDGPSAGITIATSLASALTQRKVRPHIAMTGEITLRGRVLPVGGIKEKILAAKRAGIDDILISEENRKDIEEIPDRYLTGLTFHFVENVKEVLDFALLNEKVDSPIDLTVKEESPSEKTA